METSVQKTPVGLNILRWSARILSLLLVGYFLLIFFNISITPSIKFTNLGFLIIAFLIVLLTCLAGMLIGFKWEAIGGGINLFAGIMLCVLVYYRWNWQTTYPYLIMTLPGILYLLSWYLHKKFCNDIMTVLSDGAI